VWYVGITRARNNLYKLKAKKNIKGVSTMTTEDIFEESFPQYTQVGGNHYTKFPIQPYEFISKNDLSFFQGNVIKYVL
jgi:hypothetical protein